MLKVKTTASNISRADTIPTSGTARIVTNPTTVTTARVVTSPASGSASSTSNASSRSNPGTSGQNLQRSLIHVDDRSRSLVLADRGATEVAVPEHVLEHGGGSRGGGGSQGSLPTGVMEEPHPSCLFVALTTVTEATRYDIVGLLNIVDLFLCRHFLQEILQFQVGVDEARPVGEDENHVEGEVFKFLLTDVNVYMLYRLAVYPSSLP